MILMIMSARNAKYINKKYFGYKIVMKSLIIEIIKCVMFFYDPANFQTKNRIRYNEKMAVCI